MSTSSSSADSPIPASSSFSGSAPSHSSPPTPAPPAPPLLPLDWRETAQHWRDSVVNVRRAVMIALAAAVPPPNSPVSESEDEGFSSDFPGSDSSEGEEEGYAHHPPVSPAGGPSISPSSPEIRDTSSSSAASSAFRLDEADHPNSPATPPPLTQPRSVSTTTTTTTNSSPSPASSPAAAAVLEIRRILSSLLAEQRVVEYGVMHSMPPAPTDFSVPSIFSAPPYPRTPSPFPQSSPSSGPTYSPPPPSSRPWTPRSPRSTQPRPSRRSRRCYRHEHSRDSVRATARYYGTDLGAQHALDYALDRALSRRGRGGGYSHHQYDDEDGDGDGDDEEEDEDDSSNSDSGSIPPHRHCSRYHPSPPPSRRPLPRPARRLVYPIPTPHDYNDSVYDPRRRPPVYSGAPWGNGIGSDGQYMSDVFGPVVQRGRARLEGDVGSWECVEFASLSSSSAASTSSEAGSSSSEDRAASGSGSSGLAPPAFGGPVGLGYTLTRVPALAAESWPFDTAPGDDAIPAYISVPAGLPVLAPRPVSFRHGGGWTTWGGGRHTTTTTSPCPSPSTSTSTSGSRSTSTNNSPALSHFPDSYSASLAAFSPPRFVAVAVAAAGHVSTPTTHPRAPDQPLRRHSSYSSLPLYPAPQTPVRARERVATPFPGVLAQPRGWGGGGSEDGGEDENGADGEDEEDDGEEMMRRYPATSAGGRRGYTSVLHTTGGRVVSPSRMGRMGRTTTTPTRRSRSRRDLIPLPPSRYLNASTDPGYPIHPRYPRHPRYTRHPSHATLAEEGRHTMLVGRRGESRLRPLAGGDGERVWWMRWDWRDL